MNKVDHLRTTSTNIVGISLAAAMAASDVPWPDHETPPYVTNHILRTSHFEMLRPQWTPDPTHSFEQTIAAAYASLADSQEPLGAEFEAVWDANVSQLYES